MVVWPICHGGAREADEIRPDTDMTYIDAGEVVQGPTTRTRSRTPPSQRNRTFALSTPAILVVLKNS